MSETKIKVGIAQGDINGIGYEVIIKTMLDLRITELCTPILYGSPKVAAFHRKLVSDAENFNFNIVRTADEINPKRANIINVMSDEVKVELGRATEMSVQGGIAALQAAVQDLKAGKIQALVTAPFEKQPSPVAGGQGFAGYSEYLATAFETRDLLSLLVSDEVRICVATGNIPLSQVASKITKDGLVRRLQVLNKTLQQDFLVNRPRIAVLSLNPRAGSGGAFANEEQSAIVPALEHAMKNGILAFGPYPSDSFFGSDSAGRYDAILAMYHDQGLTPFASLNTEAGISCTCGLPIVRTAPAHGPDYELAGKDKASPASFRAALYKAIDICKNRKTYAEFTKNPLVVAKMESEKN
jgi:4-hydroxythreonine-4-phosphate dehydrogenase